MRKLSKKNPLIEYKNFVINNYIKTTVTTSLIGLATAFAVNGWLDSNLKQTTIGIVTFIVSLLLLLLFDWYGLKVEQQKEILLTEYMVKCKKEIQKESDRRYYELLSIIENDD